MADNGAQASGFIRATLVLAGFFRAGFASVPNVPGRAWVGWCPRSNLTAGTILTVLLPLCLILYHFTDVPHYWGKGGALRHPDNIFV